MFKNWGRPFRLLSPLVDGTSDEFTAIQVICGWAFSSVLTKVGSVLVWWPHGTMSDSVTSKMDELDSEGNRKAHATEDGVIPCVIWDLVMDPIRLPAIPPLPKLVHVGEPGEAEEETRLVQIAGLSSHLIGLTNKGHVLKISVENENDVNESNWEYVRYSNTFCFHGTDLVQLHKFSEVEEVQKHEVFSASGDPPLVPPKTMHITHVSIVLASSLQSTMD
jgi:SCF-associated factor 1